MPVWSFYWLRKKAPDSRGHLWEVLHVGQSELSIPRRVEPPGAKPQLPKHAGDQQQDDQQPPEDKSLHVRVSARIYMEQDTGGTTLCIWIAYTYLESL